MRGEWKTRVARLAATRIAETAGWALGRAPEGADYDSMIEWLIAEIEDAEPATHVSLAVLVPAAGALEGAVPNNRVPGLVASKLRQRRLDLWKDILALSLDDVNAWSGAGRRNGATLLAFVMVETAHELAAAPERGHSTLRDLDHLMQSVVREAAAHRPEGTMLEALSAYFADDAMSGSLRSGLRSIDAANLAQQHSVTDEDPAAPLQQMIDGHQGRERAILEGRILAQGKKQTLEELGDLFEVTRERIRQLETGVVKGLGEAVQSPAASALREVIEEYGTAVGVAAPIDSLDGLLSEIDGEGAAALRAQLLAFLMGAYRIDKGWLVRGGVEWPQAAEKAVRDILDENGVAPLDAASDALASLGVPAAHHSRILPDLKGLRLWEDMVVAWGGPLQDRAATVLSLVRRPLTITELSGMIPERHSSRSLGNQLGLDPRFDRVAKQTWALASWGMDEYRGVANSIIDALQDGPRQIADLSAELRDRFGIPQASVVMLTSQSATFIVDGEQVRLRRSDEPYELTVPLADAPRCFLVRGEWAQRITVDGEVFRGSGPPIEEAFAIELGLTPGDGFSVDIGLKHLAFGWGHQRPYTGSLRLVAEALGAVEGDLLFLRVTGPRTIAVDFVRNPSEEGISVEDQVRRSIGAPFERLSIQDTIARAVGLSHDDANVEEVARRLQAKGEGVVAELYAEAAASD